MKLFYSQEKLLYLLKKFLESHERFCIYLSVMGKG